MSTARAEPSPSDALREFIAGEIGKTRDLMTRLADDPAIAAALAEIARACLAALRAGKKLLLAGNGGSAADAQHLAAEFVSRFAYDRPGLPAFALTTDTSVLTAVGNDYGYERVFARQVEAVAQAGDVFFGLSTSGRSPNVLAALSTARARRLVTVGFTGAAGAEMAPLCDFLLRIPSGETPKIQEGHITLGHILCALVEREMFPEPRR
jgi:D-sedoheptulose 7-phosphate isomerase